MPRRLLEEIAPKAEASRAGVETPNWVLDRPLQWLPLGEDELETSSSELVSSWSLRKAKALQVWLLAWLQRIHPTPVVPQLFAYPLL